MLRAVCICSLLFLTLASCKQRGETSAPSMVSKSVNPAICKIKTVGERNPDSLKLLEGSTLYIPVSDNKYSAAKLKLKDTTQAPIVLNSVEVEQFSASEWKWGNDNKLHFGTIDFHAIHHFDYFQLYSNADDDTPSGYPIKLTVARGADGSMLAGYGKAFISTEFKCIL
jgi:hypothetical protein